ncbi:class I SAM-dependent methyltransferase [Pedobacter kyonggii]|uniref:class I SAM-dependent methyltransferase n=1 Tax=Pedobacter kyonggii TaxID=1926871 RepID=UPI001ABFF92E|nr:methyltransferase domain-containing protein [Pedobacter kyonggii]
MKAIDLGCGTGEQTAILTDKFRNAVFLGVDTSAEMLGQSKKLENDRLHFRQSSTEAVISSREKWDLIFSNGALQWSDDHEALFPALIRQLNTGGQFAEQMPVQNENLLNSILIQLKTIDAKIEVLETKLFDGTIIDHTYKRWKIKYEGEKAKLGEDFGFSERLEGNLYEELQLLPYILNMPKIFQDSSLGQKHAIFNQVFKQGLTFKEGSFRTRSINPDYVHKLLIIKEKWLLFLEQPSGVFEGIPSCGESEYPLQHLQELFRIIREIYKNKKRMEDGNI